MVKIFFLTENEYAPRKIRLFKCILTILHKRLQCGISDGTKVLFAVHIKTQYDLQKWPAPVSACECVCVYHTSLCWLECIPRTLNQYWIIDFLEVTLSSSIQLPLRYLENIFIFLADNFDVECLMNRSTTCCYCVSGSSLPTTWMSHKIQPDMACRGENATRPLPSPFL